METDSVMNPLVWDRLTLSGRQNLIESAGIGLLTYRGEEEKSLNIEASALKKSIQV